MLNKNNLNIAALCSNEETRFSLRGILVRPDCTVETDGHQLVKVTTPVDMKAENFPEIPGMQPAVDNFPPFILAKADALMIAKALPKKEAIPQLMCAGVSAETALNGHAVIGVTDLMRGQTFRPKKLEGNFPDFERVIPKLENAKFQIAMSPGLLANLLKQADAFIARERGSCVTLSFTTDSAPMRIDCHNDLGQQFVGVLMPMRADPPKGSPAADMPKPEPADDEMVEFGEDTRSFADQMQAAPDADAGRKIIRNFEAAMHALDLEAGLAPTVGQIAENHYRGFSTLTPKERFQWVRRLEKTEVLGARDLMVDGERMSRIFQGLIAKEHAKYDLSRPVTPETVSSAPVAPVISIDSRAARHRPTANTVSADERLARRQAAAKKAWETMRARRAAVA